VGGAEDILKTIRDILVNPTPELDGRRLVSFVQSYLSRRDEFLQMHRRFGSPQYILDQETLQKRARQFAETFRRYLPKTKFFFAVKSNNSPAVAERLLLCGYGLDVSSGVELEQALRLKAGEIVFSGPGKTDQELAMAASNAGRVTVLIDSFAELDRLEATASSAKATIRAGVRLTTDEKGLWRKFGIPLSQLAAFLSRAAVCQRVNLCGLQFHTSWNLTPDRHISFISRLGKVLAELDAEARSMISFIDMGGGFWPEQGEWLQYSGTKEGELSRLAGDTSPRPLRHYCFPATPLDEFARRIGEAAHEHLFSLQEFETCFEPGRWVCHEALHFLLEVQDKKADDLVITDAGTNLVGWERFETDYFPVINLSRPGLVERPAYILGALCTPHDVWGYAYFGEGIEPGDVLLIPAQGAYTFSLRQNFIKPLPPVTILPANQVE